MDGIKGGLEKPRLTRVDAKTEVTNWTGSQTRACAEGERQKCWIHLYYGTV